MKTKLLKVFLSIISMCCFVYLAYSTNEQSNKNEVFIYIALALLFQPFAKIGLGRTIWNIVDFMVGVGLLISLIAYKKEQ